MASLISRLFFFLVLFCLFFFCPLFYVVLLFKSHFSTLNVLFCFLSSSFPSKPCCLVIMQSAPFAKWKGKTENSAISFHNLS